ncbi:hypothetical protein Bca52824_043237 [Brassica carinata]|uniref:Uncharacterized protein n=1 Tax=Brassica carinata TaxID=52824 RepID=A0A8X7RZU2_BRACI|nr:hypothetical protein Bca52824_043237 [Brassica carinata]
MNGEGTTREGSKEVQTVVSATRLTLTLSFPVIMSCTRRLAYADDMAKLPLKQASRLLYRYNLPNESKRPRTLSRLSDTSVWERRKTKGKVAIQKMVVDLMELYLHRLRQKRFPYPKNPTMAAQFPYNATPDQKQAFLDVDKDLTERETPMDRFICGDVGFGKTEVALRAIFCVVSAGRQAMVLAPTIVLAKQHYDVISEQFALHPQIKVGLLSRHMFDIVRTKAEKEAYLEMIKHGHLNIIVGTHSLLGSRVVYNLGLLVVDEEHRFGVKQKERIASFKTSVDVLTLSATPIPRTFYLALNGFRDASLISTPPLERIPIKTHLSSFLKEKVIKAIKNELNRGGQVFYALPRIKGLEEVMDFLEEAFPDIDIAMAHGKPYSKQLEETKERFAQGKIKILICTNIVESGLDIQNANYHNHPGCSTIWVRSVVPGAKLRGRVGRADKEAHAYLFYPEKSPISDQALERLSALEECCQLGQGFQLAEKGMGDVGNVGIDLFFEMLFESLSKVEELRIFSAPYNLVKIDIKINPRLPSKQLRKICGVSCNSQRTYAELLLELPREQLLNWMFQCLSVLHASLPALIHVYRSSEYHKQLKDSRTIYESYVPMKYKRYYKRMAKLGELEDHITLQPAADRFAATIWLLTSFRDTCFIEIMPQDQAPKRGETPEYISSILHSSLLDLK